MKHILLFCLKGFETMEFSPFVDVTGWARNDFHHDIKVTAPMVAFELLKLLIGEEATLLVQTAMGF